MTFQQQIEAALKLPADKGICNNLKVITLSRGGDIDTLIIALLVRIRDLEKQVEQSEGKFIEGYICCVAGMVQSHGADTACREAARQCASASLIRKHASPHDIKVLEENGCPID